MRCLRAERFAGNVRCAAPRGCGVFVGCAMRLGLLRQAGVCRAGQGLRPSLPGRSARRKRIARWEIEYLRRICMRARAMPIVRVGTSVPRGLRRAGLCGGGRRTWHALRKIATLMDVACPRECSTRMFKWADRKIPDRREDRFRPVAQLDFRAPARIIRPALRSFLRQMLIDRLRFFQRILHGRHGSIRGNHRMKPRSRSSDPQFPVR